MLCIVVRNAAWIAELKRSTSNKEYFGDMNAELFEKSRLQND